MFTAVSKLKYRLSHISSKNWHWKLVTEIWGRKSMGSACQYYWIKLPLALLFNLIVVIVGFLYLIIRVIVASITWFAGFRFNEKITNFDAGITDSWNYNGYREKKDGTFSKFAPWQILLIPAAIALVWYLGFANRKAGLLVLEIILGIVMLSILAFVVSRGWKNKYVRFARQNVINAWHKVCPPLYVDGEKSYTPWINEKDI